MSADPPPSGAWRAAVEAALLHTWSGRGWLACSLWPLSWLTHALVALRRWLYQWGWLHSQKVDAMVIVVGNVLAGGAGKTPTVQALVRHLLAQGRRVGIVSRGYGRRETPAPAAPQVRQVTAHSTVDEVGDEPLLLWRSTQVPVFVGRNRYAAAAALLAEYPDTEIIVCDDGLQHYPLYRDLEVCVFDERGMGNAWLLPAGPLREPWPRKALAQAGQHAQRLLVLHTSGPPCGAGFQAQRRLADHAMDRSGASVALHTLEKSSTRPLMAVAGIAKPEAFFAMLRAQGLPLAATMAFPDHYDFHSFPCTIHAGYQLLCTEKDGEKLWPMVPDALAVPLVQSMDLAFFQALDACVAEYQRAKLSSNDGHQTA